MTEPSIVTVLELIEKHGSFVLFARTVESLVTADARAALHVAGILSGAPPAATWGCEVRGCGREIRSNYDGARRPLVAVCSQVPTACAPVELTFEEVAQQQLSVQALVSAACALLGAVTDRAALATLNARMPIGDAQRPVRVATKGDPACDVFWAASPRETDLGAFCARRERVARRTLVLVPTGTHLPLDVAARFAAGEAVEILPLADALVVQNGKLALTPLASKTRATEPPIAALSEEAIAPAPLTPRTIPGKRKKTLGAAGGIAAALGVTRWGQIRMTMVDEMTVRIQGNGASVLKTFVELGFLDKRKVGEAMPVQAWGLFVLLCRQGRFRPSAYAQMGKKWGAKKAVQTMRDALKGVFGLAEDPLLGYSPKGGWAARFLCGEASDRA